MMILSNLSRSQSRQGSAYLAGVARSCACSSWRRLTQHALDGWYCPHPKQNPSPSLYSLGGRSLSPPPASNASRWADCPKENVLNNKHVCLCGHTSNEHGAFGICTHAFSSGSNGCSCVKFTSAQQGVHLTAFGVGVLAFLAGFGACWLVFIR